VADPLLELLTALEATGRPPLPWVVRWSAGGRDPLHEAWRHTGSDWAMLQVLLRVGGLESARYVAAYDAADAWARARSRHPAPHPVSAIRRAVPTPPTLAELLAAR
jgi:hypothetical protein